MPGPVPLHAIFRLKEQKMAVSCADVQLITLLVIKLWFISLTIYDSGINYGSYP